MPSASHSSSQSSLSEILEEDNKIIIPDPKTAEIKIPEKSIINSEPDFGKLEIPLTDFSHNLETNNNNKPKPLQAESTTPSGFTPEETLSPTSTLEFKQEMPRSQINRDAYSTNLLPTRPAVSTDFRRSVTVAAVFFFLFCKHHAS